MENKDDKLIIEKMMLVQKSLAIMVKEKEQIIQSQKKELEEKDKEISRLKDLNKSTEKKNEENLKFSSKINISDINELKQKFDSDKIILSDHII